MVIILTPDQEAWLRSRVAGGKFSSIEEAVRQLVDERIAEIALEEGGDLDWAKPYVDEARADVARGDIISLEEHESRNVARLAALKD